MLEIIVNALKQIPLFEQLELEKHRDAISKIQLMYFPAGHVIFRKGSPSEYLYVVKNGTVEIYPDEEHVGTEPIATIEQGGFFGEMSLLEGKPRNATAVAKTDVEAFYLGDAIFRQLAGEIPELDARLVEEYLRRKQENLKQMR